MSNPAAAWGGLCLGLGLAGFFDGILLHQILQWHHLLSNVREGPLGDLRGQILADGLFHAAMYLIVAVGMWLVWKARSEMSGSGAGRQVFAHLLIGFGAWHLADGILVHWLLGLHRINPGSAIPLVWDLLFLGLGIAALAAGLILKRRPPGPDRNGPVTAMVILVVLMGVAAVLPWRSGSAVTVVFGPDTTPPAVFAAVKAADARMVWTDTKGVWVLSVERPDSVLTLYRHGAWLVSGAYSPAGCFTPKDIGSRL
ncbi:MULTISPECIES: DUF2243 domain-containing protein [Asticcacaulis]|uniref:DUF2243 domain-containing protein n=1 Tax=Asticcacaulis TaxID=76890 RepID=UPI001AE30823|nr:MULTISPECIES: DUF2243 domain-containing protein [Asticcacaulis]MBP2159363.1 putative membrane protein [Asticcacaulis solisilvae]MDR6800408.1 putative membrane protein [Asticcacaulis sp. BE141]